MITLKKRGLLALFSLLFASILALFLTVPWAGLQCVVVAFDGNIDLRTCQS